jgi:flagellar hook-basal body complex protein FliE
MVTNEMDPSNRYLPLVQQQTQKMDFGASERAEKFTDTLKELITDVNSLKKDSAELTEKMIKGEPVDLHDVMIASAKAKTGFQLLMEMRNKFVDMYKEVSRMQV